MWNIAEKVAWLLLFAGTDNLVTHAHTQTAILTAIFKVTLT